MANPNVDATIAEITAALTVFDSAIVYIHSVPGLLEAAVAQALANGATEAELAPLSDLVTALRAKEQETIDALAANTGTTPPSARKGR